MAYDDSAPAGALIQACSDGQFQSPTQIGNCLRKKAPFFRCWHTLLDTTGVARYVMLNYYIASEPYVTAEVIYLLLPLSCTRFFKFAKGRRRQHLVPRVRYLI